MVLIIQTTTSVSRIIDQMLKKILRKNTKSLFSKNRIQKLLKTAITKSVILLDV